MLRKPPVFVALISAAKSTGGFRNHRRVSDDHSRLYYVISDIDFALWRELQKAVVIAAALRDFHTKPERWDPFLPFSGTAQRFKIRRFSYSLPTQALWNGRSSSPNYFLPGFCGTLYSSRTLRSSSQGHFHPISYLFEGSRSTTGKICFISGTCKGLENFYDARTKSFAKVPQNLAEPPKDTTFAPSTEQTRRRSSALTGRS